MDLNGIKMVLNSSTAAAAHIIAFHTWSLVVVTHQTDDGGCGQALNKYKYCILYNNVRTSKTIYIAISEE